MGGHQSAFWNSPDFDGPVTLVKIHDAFKAGFGEREAVLGEEFGGFGYILAGDGLKQLRFEDGLEAEEKGLREASAAAFKVSEEAGGARWILEEVRGFVAVGIENRVECVVLHRVKGDNRLI